MTAIKKQIFIVSNKGFATVYLLLFLHVFFVFILFVRVKINALYIFKQTDQSFHFAELSAIHTIKNKIQSEEIEPLAYRHEGIAILIKFHDTSAVASLSNSEHTKVFELRFDENSEYIIHFEYLDS